MRDYIENLQAHGCYTFSKIEAIQSIGFSANAFKVAAARAQKKGLIAQFKQGFFVIIPVEYRSAGSLPPSWFIDKLMNYLNLPYYVGLLSAAALQGAAHQQPQVFQVITNKQLSSISIGRVSLQFIYKKKWPESWSKQVKTNTGFMRVSTPEATAIDLARFITHGGYIDNIAIVISELSEIMNTNELRNLINTPYCQNASLQRLGYLLTLFNKAELSAILSTFLKEKKLNYVPLMPGSTENILEKNKEWHININHQIEEDI